MSSFFVRASRVKTPTVDYNAEGNWIDVWESKKPLPPMDENWKLRLTYSATTREPTIFTGTKQSNPVSLKGHEQELNLLRWHDTGQEKVRIFAGGELYWSNQIHLPSYQFILFFTFSYLFINNCQAKQKPYLSISKEGVHNF